MCYFPLDGGDLFGLVVCSHTLFVGLVALGVEGGLSQRGVGLVGGLGGGLDVFEGGGVLEGELAGGVELDVRLFLLLCLLELKLELVLLLELSALLLLLFL